MSEGLGRCRQTDFKLHPDLYFYLIIKFTRLRQNRVNNHLYTSLAQILSTNHSICSTFSRRTAFLIAEISSAVLDCCHYYYARAMVFPFQIREHVIPSQHVREYAQATANSQEDILYISVKQYIPIDNANPQPGDVTIIGAHANGFPKELYEPLWAELHTAAKKHSFRIRGIWIADVSNQGHSGILNEKTMGNDPSWHDHARDILHMTNVFRGEMPRPIIGVGHSFGANILTHLTLFHPRLLSTLVLFDPTITKFSFDNVGPGISPARGSAFRRDLWPSREAAAEAFKRSPFYQTWDPRVLEAWITHGLRTTPTVVFPNEKGSLTLATTRHQELFTFFRPLWPYLKEDGTVDQLRAPDFDPNYHDQPNPRNPFPFYRSEGSTVLRRLAEVRPSVFWVFGGTSDLSTPEARRMKLEACGTGPNGSGGIKTGRVGHVVMEGRGHLFPMEIPELCAEHAAEWIDKEMQRFRKEQREYDEWTKLPLIEKTTMSEEFLDKVGGLGPRAAKKPAVGQSKL
ncbi:Alpha/beta hydrolase family-domain-containing protein [Pseudomassariella vexata]|uniref:Alpha/beta hydrolase family-domain-containing protein n=1 Tax=Pseudomassariella vexata TaxID=1141098 RepID=A0A1Y2DQ42_9PEZI|nr:Alpha/beta hydrolase family-domain-containing protein [Pseudomassariella vexata]ORY61299.1 Alpha/beta hydrolase family-domain-containing protein [Pseudomassariella vexata]